MLVKLDLFVQLSSQVTIIIIIMLTIVLGLMKHKKKIIEAKSVAVHVQNQ